MNDDKVEGGVRDLGGKLKENVGSLTGNSSLQGEGIVDQVSGTAQKVLGTARETLNGGGPLIDQAKGFAKSRPFAAAALVGVIGVALLNTLRGKK